MHFILQLDPYCVSYSNLKWSRDFLDTLHLFVYHFQKGSYWETNVVVLVKEHKKL